MVAFYSEDSAAKAKLVNDIRECCLYNGFFQITNHRVPIELQQKVMGCVKQFFDLTLEQKMEVDKSISKSQHPPFPKDTRLTWFW